MLLLTRKCNEGIRITLDPRTDATVPVGELFAAGPIEIRVLGISDTRVKLAVVADPRLRVERVKLEDK